MARLTPGQWNQAFLVGKALKKMISERYQKWKQRYQNKGKTKRTKRITSN